MLLFTLVTFIRSMHFSKESVSSSKCRLKSVTPAVFSSSRYTLTSEKILFPKCYRRIFKYELIFVFGQFGCGYIPRNSNQANNGSRIVSKRRFTSREISFSYFKGSSSFVRNRLFRSKQIQIMVSLWICQRLRLPAQHLFSQ